MGRWLFFLGEGKYEGIITLNITQKLYWVNSNTTPEEPGGKAAKRKGGHGRKGRLWLSSFSPSPLGSSRDDYTQTSQL